MFQSTGTEDVRGDVVARECVQQRSLSREGRRKACWMGPFGGALLRNIMPFVGGWGLLVKRVLKTLGDVFYGFPLISIQ